MESKQERANDFKQTVTNDEIFHLSNDGIFIVDQEGYIINANERAADLFGYSVGEMARMPIYKLHPEAERPQGQEKFQETREKGFARFTIGALRKDGEKREVEISASRSDRNGQAVFIAMVRDFTEQNRALRKIDQLSQFPEQNPFPVIRTNAAYQLEYANQASKDLLKALDIQIGDYLPSEWQEKVDTICKNGNCLDKSPNFEFKVENRYLLFSVAFINDGRQVYLYGQDISNLKHYQQALKSTNDELNTFIYKTHHDLKNPVSSLLGLVQLAEEETTEETANSYLKMIHQTASKLDAILVSLIKAIEVKDRKRQAIKFSVEDLLSQVFERVKLLNPSKEVSFSYDVNRKLSTISQEWHTLFYVLENLLNNAVKYTDPAKNRQWAKVSVYPDGDHAIFQVSDNGIGIPAPKQDQIFTMFYRANNSRKGTGLGLYIVQKGIEKIGGTLSLDSEEGKGTSFYLHIPYSYG